MRFDGRTAWCLIGVLCLWCMWLTFRTVREPQDRISESTAMHRVGPALTGRDVAQNIVRKAYTPKEHKFPSPTAAFQQAPSLTTATTTASASLAASAATMASRSVAAVPQAPRAVSKRAETACKDTQGWHNHKGMDCSKYAKLGYCDLGAVSEGREWAVGRTFNYPERHCCSCGKMGPILAQPVPDSPSSARLRALNEDPFRDAELRSAYSLNATQTVPPMYGLGGPRMLGLERCASFRTATPVLRRKFAVAGLYNTGTHVLHQLMQQNCALANNSAASKYGSVPWGKHNLLRDRGRFWAPAGGIAGATKAMFDGDVTFVLPLVVIKDPLTWMASLCRKPYIARFRMHTRKGGSAALDPTAWQRWHLNTTSPIVTSELRYHFNAIRAATGICPSPLVASATTISRDTGTEKSDDSNIHSFSSLPSFWNRWHLDYIESDIPAVVHPALVPAALECRNAVWPFGR